MFERGGAASNPLVPLLLMGVTLSQLYSCIHGIADINGLVQETRNSSALAMELRLSCTNPLNYVLHQPDTQNALKAKEVGMKWDIFTYFAKNTRKTQVNTWHFD